MMIDEISKQLNSDCKNTLFIIKHSQLHSLVLEVQWELSEEELLLEALQQTLECIFLLFILFSAVSL